MSSSRVIGCCCSSRHIVLNYKSLKYSHKAARARSLHIVLVSRNLQSCWCRFVIYNSLHINSFSTTDLICLLYTHPYLQPQFSYLINEKYSDINFASFHLGHPRLLNFHFASYPPHFLSTPPKIYLLPHPLSHNHSPHLSSFRSRKPSCLTQVNTRSGRRSV